MTMTSLPDHLQSNHRTQSSAKEVSSISFQGNATTKAETTRAERKKLEPVKRKLPYEMTIEENEKVCREQLDDWFTNVREKSRQKERNRKTQVDPTKLKFFIKMQEDTKKNVLLKTNYDRSQTKSLQKKRRGGSPASYIASDDAKKKQKMCRCRRLTLPPASMQMNELLQLCLQKI